MAESSRRRGVLCRRHWGYDPSRLGCSAVTGIAMPDAVAAAYFGASIVVGGSLVLSVLLVIAYLWSGGK